MANKAARSHRAAATAPGKAAGSRAEAATGDRPAGTATSSPARATSRGARPSNGPAGAAAGSGIGGTIRNVWRTLRGIHPGLVLATLDAIGLAIASYLSYTELTGGLVQCGPIKGCETVQSSPYAYLPLPFDMGRVPVAVFGVFLSVTLLVLALSWWRTDRYSLLLWHYGLSLVGVLFEGWFQFAQAFLIGAFCVWCESYGISLILRFVIALWVYLRTPNPNATASARAGGKPA